MSVKVAPYVKEWTCEQGKKYVAVTFQLMVQFWKIWRDKIYSDNTPYRSDICVTFQLLARKKVKWILERKLTRWTRLLNSGWDEGRRNMQLHHFILSAQLWQREKQIVSSGNLTLLWSISLLVERLCSANYEISNWLLGWTCLNF